MKRRWMVNQALFGLLGCWVHPGWPANGVEVASAVAAPGRVAEAGRVGSASREPEMVLFPFDDYSLPFNNGLLLTLAHSKKSNDQPVLLPGQPGEPDNPRVYY